MLVYHLSALQSMDAILSFFFPRLQGAYKEFQFGVIVKCRQEVRHHFKLAGEDVSRELGITNALRIKDATRKMEKLMTCTLSTSYFNFKLDVMNCANKAHILYYKVHKELFFRYFPSVNFL